MRSITFMLCLTICFCTWIAWEYKTNAIKPVGYSKETLARMDELVAQITPLSVADLEQ